MEEKKKQNMLHEESNNSKRLVFIIRTTAVPNDVPICWGKNIVLVLVRKKEIANKKARTQRRLNDKPEQKNGIAKR